MATRQAQSKEPISKIGIWLAAIRPKTLLLSLSPVLLAALIAAKDAEPMLWLLLPVIMIAAMCIQIATNLWNDAADSDSGLDDQHTRLGPPRMTSLGLLSPQQIRIAVFIFLGIAAVAGLVLVSFGGLLILVIGGFGLLCALAYSSGPYPIAASPFGEIFVLAFFGLLAVGGSHYLLTGSWSETAMLAGLYAGLPAAAVLTVNNHRDRVGDREGGRKTLAILLGPELTKIFYTLIMSLSAFGPLQLGQGTLSSMVASSALLLVALALPVRALWTVDAGPLLNKVLAQTAAYQLIWVALFGLWLFSA